MPTYRSLSAADLVTLIAGRVLARPGRVIVALDGADAAEPGSLAAQIVSSLRAAGRDAAAIPLHGYVRPASLRLEFGRAADSYRDSWFDYPALDREVLRGLRARGSWLPALWDEVSDRSTRASLRAASDGTVLVVHGPMLLGRGLDFDLTVRLDMTEPALLRRTPVDQHWTVPALVSQRVEEADFFVRWDHPERPALRVRGVQR